MSRYIERDVARDYLHAACEFVGGNAGIKLKINFDQEPDADVVEVVRCKDCKNNQNPRTSGNANCGLLYGMTDQEGFCSFGERREDGEVH